MSHGDLFIYISVIVVFIAIMFACIIYMKQKCDLDILESRYKSSGELINELDDYNQILAFYREAPLFDLGKQENVYKKMSYTGNLFLDSILSYKRQQAEDKGITINIDCDNVLWRIDDTDTVALIFNLMDNAIEAAADSSKAFIQVRIKHIHDGLILHIQNSKSDDKTLFRSSTKSYKPVTIKNEAREHGFGVLVVNELVHRYLGKLELADWGDYFSAEIMLPRDIPNIDKSTIKKI